MDATKQHIEKLIEKAAEANQSGDAMRFAQAASNAANALCSVKFAERGG